MQQKITVKLACGHTQTGDSHYCALCARAKALNAARSTAQDTRASYNSAGSLIVGSRVRIGREWYSNVD